MKTLYDQILAAASPETKKRVERAADLSLHFDIETGGLDPTIHPTLEYSVRGRRYHKVGFINPGPKFSIPNIDEWSWKHLLGSPDKSKINNWKDVLTTRLQLLTGDVASSPVIHGGVKTTLRVAMEASLARGENVDQIATVLSDGLKGRNLVIANIGHESKFLAEHLSTKGIKLLSSSMYMNQPKLDADLPLSFRKFYPEGNQALDEALYQTGLASKPESTRRAWARVYAPWVQTATTRPKKYSYILDLQDLIRSNIAQAQISGLLPKHRDVFSGTAVNYWSIMLGMGKETHWADMDTKVQDQIMQAHIAMGAELRSATGPGTATKKLLSNFGEALPDIRTYVNLKTFAEYKDNPQRMEVGGRRVKRSIFQEQKGWTKRFFSSENKRPVKSASELRARILSSRSATGLDLDPLLNRIQSMPKKEALDFVEREFFEKRIAPKLEGISRPTLFDKLGTAGPTASKLFRNKGKLLAGTLLAGSIIYATRAYNRHREDMYSDIEGLHPGAGEKSKWSEGFKEFGSGYKGPNPELQPEYNTAQDVPALDIMRMSTLSHGRKAMRRYMLEQRPEDPEYLAASASAGTALHMLKQGELLASGEIQSAENFVADPINRVVGHIDVIDKSGRVGDIKTVSERKWRQLQKMNRPFKAHAAQVSGYMAITGNTKPGFISYYRRENPNDVMKFQVQPDSHGYQEAVNILNQERARAEQMIMSGEVDQEDLPRVASIERLMQDAEGSQSETEEWASNLGERRRVFEQEMDYLHDVERRSFPIIESNHEPTKINRGPKGLGLALFETANKHHWF